MKPGRPFIIQRLSRGFPYTNVPGTYLNSPRRWQECGVIVARDEIEAQRRAEYNIGTKDVRVIADDFNGYP